MRRVTRAFLMALLLALPILAAPVPGGGHARAASEPAQTTTEASAETPGLWTRAAAWVIVQQRAFHREMTGYLRTLRGGFDLAAALALIGVSFAYGVLHAAGPGHGKAVISGYLISHRQTVRRGIVMAAAGALAQGITAIVLVYGLVGLAGWLPRETQTAVLWSERASFALVAALGGFLLLRALRGLLGRGHGHAHRHAHRGQDHAHDHGHEVGAEGDCGHAHMPSAADAARATDLKAMAAIVASVGLRPCTGAIVVLVFANVAALTWTGIGAVLAMSAGTALAVAVLAAFAVKARDLMARLPVGGGVWLERAAAAVAGLAGLLILLFGVSLLTATLDTAHPLLGG